MLLCMSARGGVAWVFLVEHTYWPSLCLMGSLRMAGDSIRPSRQRLPSYVIPCAQLSPVFLLIPSWGHHVILPYPMPAQVMIQCTWHWWCFHLCGLLASWDLTCMYLGNKKILKFSFLVPSIPSALCLPPVIQGLSCQAQWYWCPTVSSPLCLKPPSLLLVGVRRKLLWEILLSVWFVLCFKQQGSIGRHGLEGTKVKVGSADITFQQTLWESG